ncbi:hypothetical protein [Magnetofaba australis]|uniref:Uncharacterized protein n=1 Tax=Magnetofaba australis IT-1 TaxID=1434232 RepID=A0A1Y2K6A9_9PROT|nr:hypothetical protein [Magnetofaba australis]OSM04827.1 hypothetical protein MAIT1_02922 [Magnetofaba australis IT-1]
MGVLALVEGGRRIPDESATAPADPALAELAALGATGRVDLARADEPPEALGALARLLGLSAPSGMLANGWFAARDADAVSDDAAGVWARVGFTHWSRKREDLLFLSPERVALTPQEAATLAADFADELAVDGWRIAAVLDDGWVIAHPEPLTLDPIVPAPLLEGLSGRDALPTGPDAKRLSQLLTTIQMLLARHPINATRKSQGRMPLNTPWIWGVGGAPDLTGALSLTGGLLLSDDPAARGLGRFCGMQAAALNESQPDWGGWAQQCAEAGANGPVIVHLRAPALLARHGDWAGWAARLSAFQVEFLPPLRQALARSGASLTLCSAYDLDAAGGRGLRQETIWVRASGQTLMAKRRFWHRRLPGEGESLSGEALGRSALESP